jgi:hypothetical protein
MRSLPMPIPRAVAVDGVAPRRSHRPLHRLVWLAVLVACAVVGPAGPAAADLGDGVTWTAVVNDRSVETTTAQDPVTLVPGEAARVAVTVLNRGDREVTVTYVRLEGAVLGLSFYVYTTRVDLIVPVGGEESRSFEVDLLDLGDQARGLIPSRVVLLDAEGRPLDAQDMTVDVRGEFTSVYGVFGVVVGAVALLLLAGALWRLATGRLHVNRWWRALALAAPGLGLGFLLTFSLSVFRAASPEGPLWAVLLLGGAAIGFVAGYLTPTPGGHAAEDRARDDGTGDERDAEEPDGGHPDGGHPDGGDRDGRLEGVRPNFTVDTDESAPAAHEDPTHPIWRR